MTFVPIAATSQSIEIQIMDDDGLPVTGLVAATFPATYYQRTREAPVQITPLVDLALQTSAWTTKGVKELTGGRYRLDIPDAAFATTAKVEIIGEASGKRIIYPVIDCGLDLSGTTVGGTGVLTESYRATAQPGTLAQLLYEILQNIVDHAIVGTTKTAKKIDGTTAKTYTLDSATNATSITELS